MPTTRFAPSPTGYLHLGHAYSALFAAEAAGSDGGRFVLRIEDIDPGRCRSEFDRAIEEDLAWLGLDWEKPVRRQSHYLAEYEKIIDKLEDRGLVYPCFCTRKEIRAEIDAAGHAPHGPDGPLYPGTCRTLPKSEKLLRAIRGESYAMRLRTEEAMAETGPLTFYDRELGTIEATPEIFGDVVLARKDVRTSYHLAVTVDDHLQNVTLVTRGIDLLPSTHIQRLLQALLGLDTPEYHHHSLITDSEGNRLAKRDKSLTLRALRESGESPESVRDMIASMVEP